MTENFKYKIKTVHHFVCGYLAVYLCKFKLKLLCKRYPEKWENGYLALKNSSTLRNLWQTMDPSAMGSLYLYKWSSLYTQHVIKIS